MRTTLARQSVRGHLSHDGLMDLEEAFLKNIFSQTFEYKSSDVKIARFHGAKRNHHKPPVGQRLQGSSY